MARTIGTGVALAGMLILLAALALAWPVPLALLLVAALNFAVLEGAAARGRLPLAVVPALLCLAVGYLVGLYLLHGDLTLTQTDCGDLLPALAVSPRSGSGFRSSLRANSCPDSSANSLPRSRFRCASEGGGSLATVEGKLPRGSTRDVSIL